MYGKRLSQLLALTVCLSVTGASWSAQGVIYVDAAATGANDGTSWTDAYVYLQDALAQAGSAAKPLEIRVAQGVYRPDRGAGVVRGDEDAAFEMLNGVTLKGGYAGVGGADPDARDVAAYLSVLSGGLAGSDDLPIGVSDQVVIANQTDASAVIDGFAVRSWFGMGIYIEAGSPTIRHCTIDKNIIGLNIRGGSPLVSDCRFSDNDFGGIYVSGGNCVLARCVFEPGESVLPSPIGPIYCQSGNLTLTDCTFTECPRGCIYVIGTLDLVRCSFVGNSGSLPGIVYCPGKLTALDCTFLDNTEEVVFVTGAAELVGCRFVNNLDTAVTARGEGLRAVHCVFSGNFRGGTDEGAAIANYAPYMALSHCIFAGNSAPKGRASAISDASTVARISHCTFVGNRGKRTTIHLGSDVEFTQCIVWDGPEALDVGLKVTVAYSNVQGGYVGEENIDVDPCFVDPGYWDSQGTVRNLADDVWVMGDYHLKSQAGHWDAGNADWVLDDVTSPCIDAGDPNAPLDSEPFPNGGFANLGAYGGTAEASRAYFGTPVCTTQIAGDINGDCKVDDLDLDILMSHWLMPDIGKPNIPPTISIIGPEDGAEPTYPEPLVLRVDASDPDGTILQVEYTIEYDGEGGHSTVGSIVMSPSDGWAWTYHWTHLRHEGVHVVRAVAIDNDGAVVSAPEITVTLRR